jgi:hypothetical protein
MPLWTESILFDHMPHIFHRETVRYKRTFAAVHVTFLKLVFRFPQMKGRGVWLVDMIGSELIRSCLSDFSFAWHF